MAVLGGIPSTSAVQASPNGRHGRWNHGAEVLLQPASIGVNALDRQEACFIKDAGRHRAARAIAAQDKLVVELKGM